MISQVKRLGGVLMGAMALASVVMGAPVASARGTAAPDPWVVVLSGTFNTQPWAVYQRIPRRDRMCLYLAIGERGAAEAVPVDDEGVLLDIDTPEDYAEAVRCLGRTEAHE